MDPRRVLLIEDESVLRTSMVRALSRLPAVDVVGVGTFAEALKSLDERLPDVVVSDIDLPDRLGLEILGELGRRGIQVPVVFLSAYVAAYRSQIPHHAHVDVREKPLGIDELREIVLARLDSARSELAPFGVADYLQLAGLGRHSVVIEVAGAGNVVVFHGEAWSAHDAQGAGLAAFCRLALRGGAVSCRTLTGDPGPRELQGSAEMLLLEAARLADEGGLPQDPVPPEHEPDFDELVDDALTALLQKRFGDALPLFVRAQALRPGDRRVMANLVRLKALLSTEDRP